MFQVKSGLRSRSGGLSLTFYYFQSLEEIEMLGTSFTVCVESWPHNLMKSIFTMLILFSQYILPIIVLPGFYYNVILYMIW